MGKLKNRNEPYEDPMVEYKKRLVEENARLWCINNNINISTRKSSSSVQWFIIVDINGKKNKSPQTYNSSDVWNEIFNFYVYYYEKYKR
jgi:hypothetical protein